MTILRILLLAAIIIAVEVLITAVPLSIWVRRNGCKTATKVCFLLYPVRPLPTKYGIFS